MEHRNIKAFELCAFIPHDDSDNAFAMILTPAKGEPFMLTMPATLSAEIAARLSEALAQCAREGQQLSVPASPERIERYNARHGGAHEGQQTVEILLVGVRSPPLYGLMTQTDARRLGAVLMAEAESSGPKLGRSWPTSFVDNELHAGALQLG